MSKVLDDVAGVRRRVDADRPGPAIPLLLLAVVVLGALVVALIRAAQNHAADDGFHVTEIVEHLTWTDPVRLSWWVFASLAAYLSAIWIARRQGYRRGVWVDRLPLALGGLAALLLALIAQLGWHTAGVMGNVPLLANLYNMENVLFRPGAPDFANADEIVGLGVVALVLFAAAAIFAFGHRRQVQAVGGWGAQ